MESALAEQVATVRANMAAACARSHRPESSVRLLAATKTVAPGRIREAYDLGLRLFGENRVQERAAKQAALTDLDGCQWHLLGPLQSNKAAAALRLFDVIETVDSVALAQRLSRLAQATVRVMLEINIGREAQKHGFPPESSAPALAEIAELPHIEVTGIMTVPPQEASQQDMRRHFASLKELSEQLRGGRANWELSMGMSHDYEAAIEEGATIVRLGTALFGARGTKL
ncbi:MAG TPA: YggS family pyridoxal phosphate-dependent enzyme [Terriglobales bacterium]|nr:YggS family pyridoxal phosphate-dependent enzyme [Terriglobales bacterium]